MLALLDGDDFGTPEGNSLSPAQGPASERSSKLLQLTQKKLPNKQQQKMLAPKTLQLSTYLISYGFPDPLNFVQSCF